MVGPATTAIENPSAGGYFDAPSVGNTTYSDTKYPLLYWTGPSSTGPMLVWQQPHIIWMTELQRLHAETDEAAAAIVKRMAMVVEKTADFMASYAAPPPAGKGGNADELWLGPPMDGGEEGNPLTETWNPTFELTYWRLGLQIASAWRARAELPEKAAWVSALKKLATPTVLPGNESGRELAYSINANCWGFPLKGAPVAGKGHQCSGAYSSHPLFVGAYGMINGASVSPPIDAAVMNSTLGYAVDGWDYDNTWGWDYPLFAFSQIRLSWNPRAAVDMLLRNTSKNLYLANGHNPVLGMNICTLSANGGLLSAVAMMAGGFLDSKGKVVEVGFPPAWGARSEGFKAYP